MSWAAQLAGPLARAGGLPAADRWRRQHGIGSALHDGAIDLLAVGGCDTAWLWVLAANDRARRMYEHRGWTSCANTIRDYLGVQELRYSRPLP